MRALRMAVLGIALLVGSQSAYAVCVGDCNNNNKVAVNELVVGVNIALDRADLDTCPSFDPSSNGKVEVNELVLGVNNLLRDSCPVVPTPTPTSTVPINTATPTSSPPPITFRPCSFGGAESDKLVLKLANAGFPPLPVQGEIGVGCDGDGSSGSRLCGCEFRRLDPILLAGIGFICIEEGRDSQGNPAQCPIGQEVCGAAGASVKIDLLADARIGNCSSNADCRTQCDAYCAAMQPPRIRFSSGCESQCQSGDRVDEPCDCDTAGTTTCPADAFPNARACPLGSCEGKDGEADVDCHCQCVDEAAPGTSPDGAFRCRLATSIRVEANPPCNGTDVLVRLPPLCAPLTSDENLGTLIDANEDPLSVIDPDPLQGASVSCSTFDTSAAGMKLVTNLAFFDSTIGDLMSQLSFTCKSQ